MILKRFLALIILLLPLVVSAEDFVVGKDYELISGASSLPKTASTKVPVLEFFSYGCPWCYRIEPVLNAWVKQQNNQIEFSRVPVVFNKDWVFYAKAYYTAQLLGKETTLSPLLFKVIQDKTATLNNNQAMIDFFIAQGIDKATATSAFENSTTIEMQLKESMQLMSRFHINGVPAVVVNNQYKADLQMAQSVERFFKILDFLVLKSRQPNAKAA